MKLNKRSIVIFTASIIGVLLLSLLSGCSGDKENPVELNISAAASLTDALQEINALYMEKHKNVTVYTNYAASGTLQKQIEQGAPADVFISAAAKQMNALEDAGLILVETRRNLLNNKVVLVVPADSTLEISSFMNLVDPSINQIAVGDPEFVPAGTYAQQAFELLGIAEGTQSKLIFGSDVRQVLGYVESGNVDVGIVYSTDAAITTGVKIVAEAPADINNKIIYPVAVVKASALVDAAKAYIDFLLTDEVKDIFERYGFSPVEQ